MKQSCLKHQKIGKYLAIFFISSLILSCPTKLTIDHYLDINLIKPIQSNYTPLLDLGNLPPINHSINSQWYDPTIEMLIITPNRTDFINAVKPLMEWKNEKGVNTIILSNFSLYNGVDDAEKIRNMIKSYYEKDKIQWVLLAGDAQEDLIPTRYVFNPDSTRWGHNETVGDDEYKPTDYYYADLTGNWDEDHDNKYGESSLDNMHFIDEISWTPEVYVGRLPANTPEDLERMVKKIIKYEKEPLIGNWMNRMLLTGGILSYNPPEFESRLTNDIIQKYVFDKMNYSHLVEPINLSQIQLVNHFNDGYSTVFMAGHGQPNIYFRNPSSIGYTSYDASISTNNDMPSLVYLSSCTNCPYDLEAFDGNLGESLIKREDAGAIGVIGALRLSWYMYNDTKLEMLNRGNAKLFWEEFYEKNKYQQGKALYDSKLSYITSSYYTNGSGSLDLDFERKQLLTYCLLGDPELDIYTDIPVMIKNPFNSNFFYECDNINLTIKDIYNNTISDARIHFESINGKYHTIYSDKNGNINLTLPLQSSDIEKYRVTITGHNLIPSYFNFTSYFVKQYHPSIINVSWRNNKLSIFDQFHVQGYVQDDFSVLESIFLILSTNNFSDYFFYQLFSKPINKNNVFNITIDKLGKGVYSFLLIARDYSNYLDISYKTAYKLTIYIIPRYWLILINLASLVIIVVIVLYISLKKISNYLK